MMCAPLIMFPFPSPGHRPFRFVILCPPLRVSGQHPRIVTRPDVEGVDRPSTPHRGGLASPPFVPLAVCCVCFPWVAPPDGFCSAASHLEGFTMFGSLPGVQPARHRAPRNRDTRLH